MMVREATVAPFPTARAVLWSPRRANAARPSRRAARFCVTQSALARLERDVAAPGHPGLGFLLGSHHRCPVLAVDFAVADTVVPWPRAAEAFDFALPAVEAMREAAAAAVAAASRELLGWFQVRGCLGNSLSPQHAHMHRALLGEAWQRTLLLAPDLTSLAGCFFHVAGEVGTLAEFYELGGAHDEGSGRTQSCVTWSDYVAARPVTILPEPVRRAIAARDDAPWSRTASVHPPAAPVGGGAAAVRVAVAARPQPAIKLDAEVPRATPARADATDTHPPSVPFPLYVPARDEPAPAVDGRGPDAQAADRWWRRVPWRSPTE